MNMNSRTMRRASLFIVSVSMLMFSGCESDAQTGGLVGAGIGALAGQAIGGDTEGTLIGAAAGAGIGYVIGNEGDKEKARDQRQYDQRSRRRDPAPSRAPDVSPEPAKSVAADALTGTTWEVVSLVRDGQTVDSESMTFSFQKNHQLVKRQTFADGSVDTTYETYTVVGDTLVIEGNGYILNALYDLKGDRMIITAPNYRTVLNRQTPY